MVFQNAYSYCLLLLLFISCDRHVILVWCYYLVENKKSWQIFIQFTDQSDFACPGSLSSCTLFVVTRSRRCFVWLCGFESDPSCCISSLGKLFIPNCPGEGDRKPAHHQMAYMPIGPAINHLAFKQKCLKTVLPIIVGDAGCFLFHYRRFINSAI